MAAYVLVPLVLWVLLLSLPSPSLKATMTLPRCRRRSARASTSLDVYDNNNNSPAVWPVLPHSSVVVERHDQVVADEVLA
jgi:hypothetical protein